mmetsp:Transcript_85719/g.247566  ORF Transcript_85719/g.247566 Transcript_85719/m.247566 type:complete len:355 (+) Transcript_85719:701-1765(+)
MFQAAHECSHLVPLLHLVVRVVLVLGWKKTVLISIVGGRRGARPVAAEIDNALAMLLLDAQGMQLVVRVLFLAIAAAAAKPDDEFCVPEADPIAAGQGHALGDLDKGAPLRACIHDVKLVLLMVEDEVEMRAGGDGLVHGEIRQQRPPRGAASELGHAVETPGVRGDDQRRLHGAPGEAFRGVAARLRLAQQRPVVREVAGNHPEHESLVGADHRCVHRAHRRSLQSFEGRGGRSGRRCRIEPKALVHGQLLDVAVPRHPRPALRRPHPQPGVDRRRPRGVALFAGRLQHRVLPRIRRGAGVHFSPRLLGVRRLLQHLLRHSRRTRATGTPVPTILWADVGRHGLPLLSGRSRR